jgi:two-component system, NarL family, sensor histidine kinase UhpB
MEQRKNIWLIFKEAVNNAVKYSGTLKMELTASLHNKEMVLQIKDFGKGFDSTVIKKGNGLDNMQHRAKELMGTLVTHSEVNTGTNIQLAVPV